MSDKKISQLTAATTPLAGTEVLPIVQSGSTVKVSVANLTAGRAVNATSITTTSDSTFNTVKVGKGGGNVASNVVVGGSALAAAGNTGTAATALGYYALNAHSSGNYNTALGYSALEVDTSGANNVACGDRALGANNGGTQNTAVGSMSGNTITTGSNNAFWGYNAQPSSATVSNEYTYGNSSVTAHRFVGGNLVIGTSGKGIDFSATASGSGTMTSELLADYEEGTWTPVIAGSTSAGTASYAAQSGTYTKIGRLVNFQAYLSWSGGTGTGDLYVSGLPYTSSASPFGIATTAYQLNVALSANSYSNGGYILSNATSVRLIQNTVGGGATSAVPYDAAGEFMISGSYYV